MNNKFEEVGGGSPGWPQEEFDYEAYKAREDIKRTQRRLEERRRKHLTKKDSEMSQETSQNTLAEADRLKQSQNDIRYNLT